MSVTKLVIATSAILAMAATLVASPESPKGSPEGADATTASIATLKANLGNPAGLVIEEVRVTDAGIACIDYRISDAQGSNSRGHAVVQGNEVVKSSSDERFEKMWNKHCLGPRGGITGAP